MTVSIARAYKPVEIDLWGSKFLTVDLPRSKSEKAKEITREVNVMRENLGTEDWDEVVAKISEGLDLRLDKGPVVKKKPSTLLKAKWKADEISLNRIFEFLSEISMAEFIGPDEDPGDDERPT